MDKLSLLHFFVAAADEGSYAGAASALGIAPSTVSKGISRLEDDLQLQLFFRSTRHIALTESGRCYRETARRILAELDQAERELRQDNDQPSGRLSVNLPISYGRQVVMPLLEGFRKKYPQIELEIAFEDAHVDLIESGTDLCIRSGTLRDSNLVARQLSPIDILTCASPAYIQQFGLPDGYRDFSRHSWIRFRYRQTGRLMPINVPQDNGLLQMDPGADFVVNDGEALAELCAQGLGLTQLPHFIARNWVMRGDIVPIMPNFREKEVAVWMIYAKRSFLPARIRVLADYLQSEIEKIGDTTYSTWLDTWDQKSPLCERETAELTE